MVFRQIVTEIGKPDVLFTEFTMTDGLVSKGKEKVAERLLKTAEQTPVVAQIWGTIPQHFYRVAKKNWRQWVLQASISIWAAPTEQ